MDKTFLLRLESTLSKIKKTLLLNEDLRKLLFYDSATIVQEKEENAISFEDLEVPAIELVRDNIFLQPVVEVDIQPPFNKKVFIAITSPSMGFESDDSVEYAIKISIQMDKTNWVYDDNKIRVYRMAQLIINDLDGVKCDCATELTFEQMLETITDKTVTGKSLLFSVVDGVGE
jgi:hypothetical protein